MKFEHFGTGIAKGLTVTLKNFIRGPITTQYPEERLTPSRRTRGNELVWSKEKCTGCATCAKTCPQGVIQIVTSVTSEGNRYTVEKFQADSGYCIFCGLCVEACPFDALYLSRSYEKAKYRRGDLILNKEALMQKESSEVSGYFKPKIEATLPQQTLLLDREKVKGDGA